MVFSSAIFLLYFLPVLLLLYYFTPHRFKNVVILVSSIFFYSWGAPKFIFVILGTTFIDFHLVRWMDAIQNKWKRRLMLSFSVSMNLGLLFYFKYSNFFIENVNAVIYALGYYEVSWTKLVLPIGISFYTFETITYVVDVYRRVHPPLKNFWDYQTYIILFPKLIAGPIIRYHELADQITDRRATETFDNRLTGFIRFVMGLSKKMLIANVMGRVADDIFAINYLSISSFTAWIGILAYTFQIYFDFSGYSDMAIGLGKIMGFRFPENFMNPYSSGSITEFWRRWHITLGAWMRNYLYIPLGGNRVKSKFRLFFNLWLVFLASGLWHGASWTFVFWGAYHGCFLIIERLFLNKFYEKIGKFPSILLTFLFVMIGWVFFRIENMNNALLYVKKLFSFESRGIAYSTDREFWIILFIAVLFAFITTFKIGNKIQDNVYGDEHSVKGYIGLITVSILLFVISLSSITASGFNPFIYFRF